MLRDINRAVARVKTLATKERQVSPATVQPTKAVRFPQISLLAAMARVDEDAPAGNIIIATLYNDKGLLVSSDDPGWRIDVYCFLSGSSNLNNVIRRLEVGDEIAVMRFPYNNEGTVEYRWYCISDGFQACENRIYP